MEEEREDGGGGDVVVVAVDISSLGVVLPDIQCR